MRLEEERNKENKRNNKDIPFNTKSARRNRRAVPVSDTAIDENLLAAYWIMPINMRKEELAGGVSLKNWKEGIIPIRKRLEILNLVKNTKLRVKHINRGENIMCSNDRKVANEHYEDMSKESDFAKEARAIVESMQREISKMKIDELLEYSSVSPCLNREFHQ